MEHREDQPRVYTARGPADGEDWQAVADALNARMAARRMGQQTLSTASGVSVSTLRQIQHGGRGRRVQNSTLSAIARALGWPEDHLIRVLLTGDVDHAGQPGAAGTAEPGMRDLHETLRRMEAQLATMDNRLAAIEGVLCAAQAPGSCRPGGGGHDRVQ